MKQRPKILHFSGRCVGGGGVLSGFDGRAVDAGIQLADGVLSSRDFSTIDLSRCVVVMLSCSWVSIEDLCGLPVLVSALMTAGAGAVVAATCNIPALARHDFLESLCVPEPFTACSSHCVCWLVIKISCVALQLQRAAHRYATGPPPMRLNSMDSTEREHKHNHQK